MFYQEISKDYLKRLKELIKAHLELDLLEVQVLQLIDIVLQRCWVLMVLLKTHLMQQVHVIL